MPINIENILDGEAFKNLEPERKQAFYRLSESLAGKSPSECIPIIMMFASNMPKGSTISKEEQQAMIGALLNSMPEAEQDKFKNILKMVETMGS